LYSDELAAFSVPARRFESTLTAGTRRETMSSAESGTLDVAVVTPKPCCDKTCSPRSDARAYRCSGPAPVLEGDSSTLPVPEHITSDARLPRRLKGAPEQCVAEQLHRRAIHRAQSLFHDSGGFNRVEIRRIEVIVLEHVEALLRPWDEFFR